MPVQEYKTPLCKGDYLVNKTRLALHSIYSIPVGDMVPDMPDTVMLYAPLADSVVLVASEHAEKINDMFSTDKLDTLPLELQPLLAHESEPVSVIKRIEDFNKLYILLTHKCNFSCSYCYSAHARGSATLDKQTLKHTIAYFINNCIGKHSRAAITFLGGGEPTVEWDLLEYGLNFAYSMAGQHNIQLSNTIVTNGFTIDEHKIDVFKKYKTLVRVSFDILEEIQNQQRGGYDVVSRNVKRLASSGATMCIRAMITAQSVDLMDKMATTLVSDYPGISNYYFDIVTDPDSFSSMENAERFYAAYTSQFLAARAYVRAHGKILSSAAMRGIDFLASRYCPGEFCVTPEGRLTICHRAASTNAADTFFQYGHADSSGQVLHDPIKLASLLAHDVTGRKGCEYCYAKWNCGGGCMIQTHQYPPFLNEIVCGFTRDFLRRVLFERVTAFQQASVGAA